MNLYEPNDGRFPAESEIQVRFPADPDTDRDEWPWMRGIILGQCGANEWHVLVRDRQVAQLDDHNSDVIWYPICYRDATELRPATEEAVA